MKLLLAVAALAVVVLLVDRLLLWMEWKGWIDYRRTYPGRFNSGQVGPAFLAIQGLLEPEKRHAAEEQTAVARRLTSPAKGTDDRGFRP